MYLFLSYGLHDQNSHQIYIYGIGNIFPTYGTQGPNPQVCNRQPHTSPPHLGLTLTDLIQDWGRINISHVRQATLKLPKCYLKLQHVLLVPAFTKKLLSIVQLALSQTHTIFNQAKDLKQLKCRVELQLFEENYHPEIFN